MPFVYLFEIYVWTSGECDNFSILQIFLFMFLLTGGKCKYFTFFSHFLPQPPSSPREGLSNCVCFLDFSLFYFFISDNSCVILMFNGCVVLSYLCLCLHLLCCTVLRYWGWMFRVNVHQTGKECLLIVYALKLREKYNSQCKWNKWLETEKKVTRKIEMTHREHGCCAAWQRLQIV